MVVLGLRDPPLQAAWVRSSPQPYTGSMQDKAELSALDVLSEMGVSRRTGGTYPCQ